MPRRTERLCRLIFAQLEPGLIGVERLPLALYPALPVILFAALNDGTGYLIERFELAWVRLANARLTVANLYDLALSGSPLVVVSACETGLIGQRGGGLVSLSRVFLAAGASGLVVSLWKMDDAATADLMWALYEAYAGGTPVAAALRQAQRQLLAERRHPFYWAPFAAWGGCRQTRVGPFYSSTLAACSF